LPFLSFPQPQPPWYFQSDSSLHFRYLTLSRALVLSQVPIRHVMYSVSRSLLWAPVAIHVNHGFNCDILFCYLIPFFY
jgi:hypothetical protein